MGFKPILSTPTSISVAIFSVGIGRCNQAKHYVGIDALDALIVKFSIGKTKCKTTFRHVGVTTPSKLRLTISELFYRISLRIQI